MEIIGGLLGSSLCAAFAYVFLFAGGFVKSATLSRLEDRLPFLTFLLGMSSARNFDERVRGTPLKSAMRPISTFRRCVLLLGAIILGMGAAIFAIHTVTTL
jgi:hypothetical protein